MKNSQNKKARFQRLFTGSKAGFMAFLSDISSIANWVWKKTLLQRLFTSRYPKKVDSFWPRLVLDNSKQQINRSIYKIYENFSWNNSFISKLYYILQDLDDNPDYVYKLYFVRMPDCVFKIDLANYINNLDQYYWMSQGENIVKLHKKTGIVYICDLSLLLLLSNNSNLMTITNDIVKNIIHFINVMNKNMHKNHGNDIDNFYTPIFHYNLRFCLFITIDRAHPMIKNRLEINKNNYSMVKARGVKHSFSRYWISFKMFLKKRKRNY